MVAFVMAAGFFSAGIACVELGVRAIKAEEADKAWSRASKEPVKAD
jgi:hypothetical protein